MGGQVAGRRRSLIEGPGAREARHGVTRHRWPLAASCSCLFVTLRAQGTWIRVFGGVACLCTPDLQIFSCFPHLSEMAICPFLAIVAQEQTQHTPRAQRSKSAQGAWEVRGFKRAWLPKSSFRQTHPKQNSPRANSQTKQTSNGGESIRISLPAPVHRLCIRAPEVL